MAPHSITEFLIAAQVFVAKAQKVFTAAARTAAACTAQDLTGVIRVIRVMEILIVNAQHTRNQPGKHAR